MIVICCLFVFVHRIYFKNKKIKDNISLIFISDLHLGKFLKKRKLEKIIKKINKIKGDYLVVGGDLIGEDFFKYYSDDYLIKTFNNIKIDKKYCVEGNHDNFNYSFYKCFNVLNNEVVDLNGNIRLLGLGYRECECLDYMLSRDNYNILLSHYPDRVINYSKIDLALGAHSHGKQVYLPFIRYKNHKEKYVKGLYKFRNNKYLYVSRGLGFSFCKIRFLSCREIVKIVLKCK